MWISLWIMCINSIKKTIYCAYKILITIYGYLKKKILDGSAICIKDKKDERYNYHFIFPVNLCLGLK